jgi:hypothetical protein
MPADGSASSQKGVRICENGSYFCKRDRNKAGTISIYTFDKAKRQTVPVGDTGECSPEGEAIDAAKLGRIELALARFVVTNVEAVVREHEGITKVDMHVKECLNMYSLAREAFHADVIRKVEDLLAKTEAGGDDPDLIVALRFQVKCARLAARKERTHHRFVMDNVAKAWPNGDGPKVSAMELPEQRHFVKVMRGIGYADSTIDMMVRITRGSMHHCHRDGRLLYPPPAPMPKKAWQIKSDEDDVVAYTLDEMVALFDAAARMETWWRYMNLSTHAPRLMTIIEAAWLQFSIGKGEEFRWKLNPPGKRRTSKRRPVIPLCPSLAAEMRTWRRDAVRVVSDGKGNAIEGAMMFTSIRNAAGIKRGSAKSVRKFVRTWLTICGVPEAIADWFVGHADEGSETGQTHYKDKRPEYMAEVVAALEKLYEILRFRVSKRRIAGGKAIDEDQPTIDDLLAALRVNGVAKLIVAA